MYVHAFIIWRCVAGCNRATPCPHCTKVLSGFEDPPAVVFAKIDRAKTAKTAKAAKQPSGGRGGGRGGSGGRAKAVGKAGGRGKTKRDREGSLVSSGGGGEEESKRARHAK